MPIIHNLCYRLKNKDFALSAVLGVRSGLIYSTVVLPTQCTYENLGHNEAGVIISNGIYGYYTDDKHQACSYIVLLMC